MWQTWIQIKMKCIWQGVKSTNESKWMETALHDWRPFHDQCSRQCLCFASQTSNVLLLMISRHAQLLELIIVDLAREEIDWVWFLLLPSAWNSHGFCIGDCFTSTFLIYPTQLFSMGLELSKTTWIAWLGFNDNDISLRSNYSLSQLSLPFAESHAACGFKYSLAVSCILYGGQYLQLDKTQWSFKIYWWSKNKDL